MEFSTMHEWASVYLGMYTYTPVYARTQKERIWFLSS